MIQNGDPNFSGTATYDQTGAFGQTNDRKRMGHAKNKKEKDPRRVEYRKLGLLIGTPFLLLLLFSLFWRRIFFLIVDASGISRDTVSDFFSRSVNQDLLSIIISTLLFIFFFTLVLKLAKRRISDIVSFKKPAKGSVLPLILAGFSFCLFSNIMNMEFASFFESFGTRYSVGSSQPDLSLLSFIMTVVSTAVIPGLVEEYACRGIIMGTLLPYGEGFALLSSAIIFGVMHGNFEQMPFAFLVGIILGYVRIKSGSLWICIFIHFSNNLFSVLVQYAGLYFSPQLREICYIVTIILSLVIGTASMFVYSKNDEALKLDDKVTDIKEKDKYKWFFTSPVMAVALVGHIILSFKYFF